MPSYLGKENRIIITRGVHNRDMETSHSGLGVKRIPSEEEGNQPFWEIKTAQFWNNESGSRKTTVTPLRSGLRTAADGVLGKVRRRQGIISLPVGTAEAVL